MAAATKESLIEALRSLASKKGTNVVSRDVFLREAKVSERQMLRLFGSYNGLVEAAGLTPQKFPTTDAPRYSDDAMLAEIVRVLRLPNAKPTRVYYENNGNISPAAVERRFGGWLAALSATTPLLNRDTDAALRERLLQYTRPDPPVVMSASAHAEAKPPTDPDAATHDEHIVDADVPVLPVSTTNVYGDFINFRGLQHAPVNEQGVVFLFGMVCRELGYVVEIVRQGFPDCEAKRRIAGRPGQWQRVRIEFEFEARSFKKHGHDPDQCDVIVCWEDNWPDCPIEVLELKSAMAKLPATV